MTKTEKRINVKERVEDDTIDLSLSDITEIPVKDIAAFKRATILDLSSNRIATLGKNFGSLTHLTKLDLSKNQLKFLPTNFGNLVQLRHLDLYDNKLEHLPLELGQLKNLRYLDLKGNPLTPALAKIVGPCLSTKDCQNAARTIVKFLSEMQVRVSEERARLKIESDKQSAIEAARLELENTAATVAEAAAAAVATNIKAKAKKERKNELKKQKYGSDELGAIDTKTPIKPKPLLSTDRVYVKALFRLFLFSSFVWILFAVTMVTSMIKYPEYYKQHIKRLPAAYQPLLMKFVENTQLGFTEIQQFLQAQTVNGRLDDTI